VRISVLTLWICKLHRETVVPSAANFISSRRKRRSGAVPRRGVHVASCRVKWKRNTKRRACRYEIIEGWRYREGGRIERREDTTPMQCAFRSGRTPVGPEVREASHPRASYRKCEMFLRAGIRPGLSENAIAPNKILSRRRCENINRSRAYTMRL